MSQPARILIADDEPTIRMTLSSLVRRAGHEPTTAEDGLEAIACLERNSFDLMVVDLKMPGKGGMDVVAAARQLHPDIAIIVLTGHGSVETAIDGLHQGVFDYILKTTEPAQVVARIKAALEARSRSMRERELLNTLSSVVQELRGDRGSASEESHSRAITIGALTLDTWRQAAVLGERTLTLTPTEFRVLLCLAEQVGTMVSYAQLVKYAQGYETDEVEAGELIKPHIHHLRQKLESEPSSPRMILNVRGKGYLLSPEGLKN